jgi:hypothetical protein
MASTLSASTSSGFLATFLDCDPTNNQNTGPFLYLPGPVPGTIPGGAFPNPSPAVPVQIVIHPHSPATSVSNAAVVLNGTTQITFVQSTQNLALVLSFSLPFGAGEVAGRWNSLDVTAVDNSGNLAFNRFYYYLNPLAPPPTTTPPLTTTIAPPTTVHPMRRPRPKSKKGKR